MLTNPNRATVGRIVHFVLPDGPAKGEHRAAIVTRTVGDKGNPSEIVNLHVFLDGGDETEFPLLGHVRRRRHRRDRVPYSAQPTPNTWHWPERE